MRMRYINLHFTYLLTSTTSSRQEMDQALKKKRLFDEPVTVTQ